MKTWYYRCTRCTKNTIMKFKDDVRPLTKMTATCGKCHKRSLLRLQCRNILTRRDVTFNG